MRLASLLRYLGTVHRLLQVRRTTELSSGCCDVEALLLSRWAYTSLSLRVTGHERKETTARFAVQHAV
jgi:hypothetical protein